MITDLKTLIDTCKQELHDREYHAHHADILISLDRTLAISTAMRKSVPTSLLRACLPGRKNGSGPSGCCSLISRLAILSSGHPVSNGLMMVKPDSSFSSFFSTNA